MLLMPFAAVGLSLLLAPGQAPGQAAKTPLLPFFSYEVAKTHEAPPHHRAMPLPGVEEGDNQIHLTLVVSADGAVVDASAESGTGSMKFWPEVKGQVMQWTFTPFEENGVPTEAKVEEYVDLAPPERMPKVHVAAPPVRKNSSVAITLMRTGCFGSCPSYTVHVTTGGIEFDGGGFVTAEGKHRAAVDPRAVRELAKTFVADDFYSMAPEYRASVTDCPTYVLSISVDGHTQRVVDYMGTWVGMPEVIADLEDEVDSFAQTKRWIDGTGGLVAALKAEGFNFSSYDAQVILKEAATRGQTDTVQELLDAGVPLKPMPAPAPKEEGEVPEFGHVGWLDAASDHPETLKVLLDAGASKGDQGDLNMALLHAARAGQLESVRELIAAGADPNADLSEEVDVRSSGVMIFSGPGSGSILIGAATGGNPKVVEEILRYHPDLEARDREGNTAVIAASEGEGSRPEEDYAQCVRLLVQAGANANAKNNDGNTALHETFLTAVEKTLLELGADVNARNNDGETPIFTTVDDDAIALYMQHGANPFIRNNKGQTAMEAASEHGPGRVEAFRRALQGRTQGSGGSDQHE